MSGKKCAKRGSEDVKTQGLHQSASGVLNLHIVVSFYFKSWGDSKISERALKVDKYSQAVINTRCRQAAHSKKKKKKALKYHGFQL